MTLRVLRRVADRDELRHALLGVLDVDEPIVIRIRHEPGPAGARLLVSLGTGWIVDADAPRCAKGCGHSECGVSVDERHGPPNPRLRRTMRAGALVTTGPSFPAWEPNLIDWRHSLVLATKRADEGDESLEICAHCGCEVDVTPAPHKPECKGIGAGRASSAPPSSVVVDERRLAARAQARTDVEGLDLLEAMDAGERVPVASVDDEETVLGEVAAVSDSAGSGSALFVSEPERADTSPSPAHSSRTPALDRWTRGAIIDALRAWATAHGGIPPSSTEWGKATADHPNSVLVKRVFGSWADAVETAGFPRPRRGVKPAFLASPAGAPIAPVARPGLIKVDGTGLAYPSPAEALDAAAEIEADGERVAWAAREDGNEGKASQAQDAARELADKIRLAAGAAEERPAPSEREPQAAADAPRVRRLDDVAALSSRSEGAEVSLLVTPEAMGSAARVYALAAIAAARTFADTLEQLLADETEAAA